MTVTATFAPGTANELVLDESNFISINPVLTHSGKADLRAELEERRDLDDYAQRKDRMNLSVDGEVIFTGYVIGTPHNERTGTTTLRADGIFMRLEETRPDYEAIGGPVQYTSIALHDAIRDYWGRTPFSNYTVTDQTPENVAIGEKIQSAATTTEWESITSIDDTEPFAILNGNLELAQTCFTEEGEGYDSGNETRVSDPPDLTIYSGGDAAYLSRGPGATGGPDFVEYNFTVNYTIPSTDFTFNYRYQADGTNGAPEFSITLQHANGSDYLIDENPTLGLTKDTLSWVGTGLSTTYDGPDLTPGDYTVRIEVENSTGTADNYYMWLDAVAPNDGGFTYTFDDDNGGNSGYLDGPELYPQSREIELGTELTSYNIDIATVNSTWTNESSYQAIGLSNDGGANYTVITNSSDVSHDFANAGRQAKVRFRFGRSGSRTTATPQTGYLNDGVDTYTLAVDLNDLIVVDSLELSRDHFSNLQKLHDYGDFVFTVDHTNDSIANIPVYSFERGEETRTSPSEWDKPENKNPEVKADNYFNSMYLEGGLRDDGTRPTAEVKDSTAISNDGREIQAFLRDSSITTEAGATFRANALLQASLSQNDLEGTIASPPNIVTPGFAYSVDFGNGPQTKTLESISLNKSNDTLRATNEFTVREGFSREIDELKRNQRDVGDQV